MTQNGSICAEEYVVKRGDSFYLIAHKLGVPLRDLLAANRDIHPARLMVGDVLCIPREEDDRPQGGAASGTGSAGSGNAGVTNSGAGSSNADNAGATGSDNANGTPRTGTPEAGTTPPASGTTSNNPSATDHTVTNNPTSGSTGTTGNTSSDNAAAPGLSCPIEEQVTLQQGETIADIQLQNLLSRNTLQTANPAVDLDTLRAGQTICVPTENVACQLPPTYTLTAGETLEAVAMRFNLPLGSLLRVNPCLAPQDFEEGVTVILPR